MTAEGKVVGGTGKLFCPLGNGKHHGVYERIIIKRIGGSVVKIDLKEITVREVAEGYVDNAEEGVVGYGGRLDIRPKYQREFVYDEKKRNAVIDTIRKGFPLNVMYWVVTERRHLRGAGRPAAHDLASASTSTVTSRSRSTATRWRSTTCPRRCRTRSSTTS